MPEFKFQIGDLLVHRGQQLALQLAPPKDKVSAFFGKEDGGLCILTVVGRQADECSEGVQFHYVCRATWMSGIGTSTFVVNETEVELAPKPRT